MNRNWAIPATRLYPGKHLVGCYCPMKRRREIRRHWHLFIDGDALSRSG